MSDDVEKDEGAEEARESEPPVAPEYSRYQPPSAAAQTQNRVRIVLAVILVCVIAATGIASLARIFGGPTTQSAYTEPTRAPGVPEPAGSIGPGPYQPIGFDSPSPIPPNPYDTPEPLSQRQAADEAAYAQKQQQAQAAAAALAQRQAQAQMAAQQEAQLEAQQRALQAQQAQQVQQVPAIGVAPSRQNVVRGASAPSSDEFDVGNGTSANGGNLQTSSYGASAQSPPTSVGANPGYRGSPESTHADRQIAYLSNQNQQNGMGYVRPVSPYLLNPTTSITARLISDVNSDLPGPVEAVVTQRVYTSRGHRIVVIPEGTRLFGNYDSAVIAGQNNLLFAFTQLVFANGCAFSIGAQPATDAEGRSGLSGHVDNHTIDLFRSAFLLTILGVSEGLLVPQNTSVLTSQTIGQTAAQQVGQQLSQIGNRVINRQLDRQPTIKIDTPYEFQIMVTKPLPLDQYQTEGDQCFQLAP